MKKRILCLALLAALAFPAAGWAKGAVIDPNGQQLTADDGSGPGLDLSTEETGSAAEDPLVAPVAAPAPTPTPAWLDLVYRFLEWLGVRYHPL